MREFEKGEIRRGQAYEELLDSISEYEEDDDSER